MPDHQTLSETAGAGLPLAVAELDAYALDRGLPAYSELLALARAARDNMHAPTSLRHRARALADAAGAA
jgi:hypothetical protein